MASSDCRRLVRGSDEHLGQTGGDVSMATLADGVTAVGSPPSSSMACAACRRVLYSS